MTRKNNIRLIAGAVCIFIAVLIAILDFLQDMSFSGPVKEPAPVVTSEAPQQAMKDADTEVCEMDGKPCEVDETLTVLRGDTLSSVLTRAEIDAAQVAEVIEQLQKVFDPRELRPEHEVYISYFPVNNGKIKKDLQSLYIRPSIDLEIYVQRNERGAFTATKEKKQLKREVRIAKGTIQNSLYIDAGKQNVPPKILHEMIQAFSYDIDFQRSFHAGDGYGLIYDVYSDTDSLREEAGQLHFAILQLQDKTYKIYRFKPANGTMGFFNEKGESIKKGLLRTPIDGARISSPFGNRLHPILGYTKMHRGVDFAAPSGTPIMAAGDGVVVKAEFYGAYGRYVQIRHNHEFSTAYAHMSRFARGLRVGSRVRQGQVIGYVGATGRTTGPHLHYELIRFQKPINPNSIKMLPTARLSGKDFHHFQALVTQLNQDFAAYQPPTDHLLIEVEEEQNTSPPPTAGETMASDALKEKKNAS
jgi:murein DD-endopeptidase MepM/ murein hydrolase activator NlpD